jgi:hypothetical protein
MTPRDEKLWSIIETVFTLIDEADNNDKNIEHYWSIRKIALDIINKGK